MTHVRDALLDELEDVGIILLAQGRLSEPTPVEQLIPLEALARQLGREHLLDVVHADAALRERQRDPPRADPELERGSVAGELGEEVDDRLDDGAVEHVGTGLVIPRCNALAEVILGTAALCQRC